MLEMDVSERLKTLPEMSKSALSRLWEELFNKPVPERIRKELMVRILAYRIQEQAFRGLNSKTRRRLIRLLAPWARTRMPRSRTWLDQNREPV